MILGLTIAIEPTIFCIIEIFRQNFIFHNNRIIKYANSYSILYSFVLNELVYFFTIVHYMNVPIHMYSQFIILLIPMKKTFK